MSVSSDQNLVDANAAADAVRELASRLKLFTREREQLLTCCRRGFPTATTC